MCDGYGITTSATYYYRLASNNQPLMNECGTKMKPSSCTMQTMEYSWDRTPGPEIRQYRSLIEQGYTFSTR